MIYWKNCLIISIHMSASKLAHDVAQWPISMYNACGTGMTAMISDIIEPNSGIGRSPLLQTSV